MLTVCDDRMIARLEEGTKAAVDFPKPPPLARRCQRCQRPRQLPTCQDGAPRGRSTAAPSLAVTAGVWGRRRRHRWTTPTSAHGRRCQQVSRSSIMGVPAVIVVVAAIWRPPGFFLTIGHHRPPLLHGGAGCAGEA
jgi:hypothetical protein